MSKTISIYGKTSDCFGCVVKDASGKIVKKYDGYPPMFLGDGDAIEFTIDLETGKILNWKPNLSELEED